MDVHPARNNISSTLGGWGGPRTTVVFASSLDGPATCPVRINITSRNEMRYDASPTRHGRQISRKRPQWRVPLPVANDAVNSFDTHFHKSANQLIRNSMCYRLYPPKALKPIYKAKRNYPAPRYGFDIVRCCRFLAPVC